jgi:hypothetical protein
VNRLTQLKLKYWKEMKKQNHRQIQVRGKEKKSKAHNQELETKKLQDKSKQALKRKKKTKIAVRRLEGIRDEDEEKATNQAVKQQLRQEIEKKLNAEQQVFDMKEAMEFLRTEIAVVKEKYLELKGQDLNPLIDAIRDLQVEPSEQNLHLKETTCDSRFRPGSCGDRLGLVRPGPPGSIQSRRKVDENGRSVITSLSDRETFSMAHSHHAETVAVNGRRTIEVSGHVRTWIDSRKAHGSGLTEWYGTPQKVSHARERFHLIRSSRR